MLATGRSCIGLVSSCSFRGDFSVPLFILYIFLFFFSLFFPLFIFLVTVLDQCIYEVIPATAGIFHAQILKQ